MKLVERFQCCYGSICLRPIVEEDPVEGSLVVVNKNVSQGRQLQGEAVDGGGHHPLQSCSR